jgi:hypothetical protein
VCWIYGWTRRLTVPAGACTHACGEAQGDYHGACIYMFRSQDFGLKLNWEAPMGSWCILFCLQNGTLKTRVDKVRYWTAVARLFPVDLCRSEYGGGWIYGGSGHEDSSHNILTLDALQVLSRSQVTPGVVNVHADYGRYVKVYIHTYCFACN